MDVVNTAILDPNVGWTILGLFSALWIALGWFWGRKARELDDYVLAGRRVGLDHPLGYVGVVDLQPGHQGRADVEADHEQSGGDPGQGRSEELPGRHAALSSSANTRCPP